MPRKSLQTLSEPMYYVLLALTKEHYGTQIMQEVSRISKGRIKMGPGTLYTMLDKFYTAELIKRTSYLTPNKSYIITDKGRQVLRQEYERLCTMLTDAENIMGGL